MAQSNVTAKVEHVQHYIHGVAKYLVDRLYGPDGPPWGTKLSELEDVVVILRERLSQDMLDQTLQRQAQATATAPGVSPLPQL